MKNQVINLALPVTMMLLLCLCGCNKNKTSEIDTSYSTISVEVKPRTFITQEAVFSDRRLVPLETPADALIGNVDKMIETPSHYIMLDNRNAMGIFVFDKSGKYVSSIQQKGKGPGQYERPNDIAFDDAAQEIHIYAHNSRKILIYGLDGAFRRETPLTGTLFPHDFSITKKGNT